MTPQVRVQFGDDALATVAAHLALRVPGVVRLQPRLHRRIGALATIGRRPRTADSGGVEVTRVGAGVELGLRIVTTTEPPPVHTVRAVVDAVRAGVHPLVDGPVEVAVTIVDVAG